MLSCFLPRSDLEKTNKLFFFLFVAQEFILRIIWPRETPRDRAAVVMGIRPYFDAGWFNYPKYYAQDLLVVVVRRSVFFFVCVFIDTL